MSSLRIGAAKADITPELPVWTAGYANRDHKAERILDPLTLTAVVLEDGGTTSVLISLDLIGLDFSTAGPLRASVAEAAGVEARNVQLSCSHTHFGPVVGPMRLDSADKPFLEAEPQALETITESALTAVRSAMDSRRPAGIKEMTISAPPIAFNRRFLKPNGRVVTHFRYPGVEAGPLIEQEYDDRLTVLRFDAGEGAIALLVHLACHPVCNADDAHYAVSSDYVHHLRAVLEEKYGCPVLFLQGAAGDVVPADRFADSRLRVGRALADSIIANEPRLTEVESVVQESSVSVDLDLCIKLPGSEAASRFDAVSEERRSTSDSPSADLPARFRYAQSAVFFDSLYGGRTAHTDLSMLKVGSLIFVFMPFEVLSSLSLSIERLRDDVRVAAYSNGYQGYLPTALEAFQGGYEGVEGSRHTELGEAERILELILEAVETTYGGEDH